LHLTLQNNCILSYILGIQAY